jgi:PPM family protein phosphatase
MKHYGATHMGRRRGNNEDAFQIEPGLGAAILADGMGGENCGEVGSSITVEAITEYLQEANADVPLDELAKEAIREANRRVIEAARDRRECNGMGSTVVLALWRLPALLIANVGDSRAYLFRAGQLRQLSYDQNFANELRTKLGLSEERVRAMPDGKVLTMAIGTYDQVLIHVQGETLEPGDQVLLCSDGLHGPVDDGAIAKILDAPEGIRDKVDQLIARANENGGPDNVTVLLLEHEDG